MRCHSGLEFDNFFDHQGGGHTLPLSRSILNETQREDTGPETFIGLIPYYLAIVMLSCFIVQIFSRTFGPRPNTVKGCCL